MRVLKHDPKSVVLEQDWLCKAKAVVWPVHNKLFFLSFQVEMDAESKIDENFISEHCVCYKSNKIGSLDLEM